MSAVMDLRRIDDSPHATRRLVKTSDLPLSSAKRESIESLLKRFKKDGSFDRLRKHVLDKFDQSVCPFTVTGREGRRAI